MNRYLISTLLLFLTTLNHTVLAQEKTQADNKLKEYFDRSGAVGISAGYAIAGDVIWQNSMGYSCKKDEQPIVSSTLFRTASIAKPMTAIAIMQLFENGLIQLDTNIQTYLPFFPKKQRGVITVRHLLSHTSGISQYQNTKEVENSVYFNNLEEAMKVFEDRPLLFDPGTDFFYTSYGYVVLGRIIEEVSGLTFEEYMIQNVWIPADMKNTGVEYSHKTYEEASCLYHKKRKKAKEAKANDLSNRVPGGGFYSTLEDLLLFGNAVVEGKLMKNETFELMLAAPSVQKEGNPYGLGWFFYGPPPNDNLVIGHSGEQTGCANQLMIIPKSKTVIVVLSNTSGTWRDIVGLTSELVAISEKK